MPKYEKLEVLLKVLVRSLPQKLGEITLLVAEASPAEPDKPDAVRVSSVLTINKDHARLSVHVIASQTRSQLITRMCSRPRISLKSTRARGECARALEVLGARLLISHIKLFCVHIAFGLVL